MTTKSETLNHDFLSCCGAQCAHFSPAEPPRGAPWVVVHGNKTQGQFQLTEATPHFKNRSALSLRWWTASTPLKKASLHIFVSRVDRRFRDTELPRFRSEHLSKPKRAQTGELGLGSMETVGGVKSFIVAAAATVLKVLMKCRLGHCCTDPNDLAATALHTFSATLS